MHDLLRHIHKLLQPQRLGHSHVRFNNLSYCVVTQSEQRSAQILSFTTTGRAVLL